MKTVVVTFFLLFFLQKTGPAQPVQHTVPLEVMKVAMTRSSMDSVPLKLSVPDDTRSPELTFSVLEEESGEIFITGTPYDSIQVQVPAGTPIHNQYGEQAELQDFQLMYGTVHNVSAMDVVSPAGCVTLQLPESGRINIRLGGRLVSDDNLRGIYTGSIHLDCKRE